MNPIHTYSCGICSTTIAYITLDRSLHSSYSSLRKYIKQWYKCLKRILQYIILEYMPSVIFTVNYLFFTLLTISTCVTYWTSKKSCRLFRNYKFSKDWYSFYLSFRNRDSHIRFKTRRRPLFLYQFLFCSFLIWILSMFMFFEAVFLTFKKGF